MNVLRSAADEFLGLGRIAVLGVSRDPKQPANLIYRKLRGAGRTVFAVNPAADEVEGDRCHSTVGEIPGGIEGAVIVTRPGLAAQLVDECAAAGATHIWMHRSFGPGSVSEAAIERCRALGLRAIPGSCPMMFCAPVDVGHRCMRFLARVTGGLPLPLSP